MGLQPSASKTDLLLACQRPFDPAVIVERDAPTDAMRYGSAFHLLLATLLLGRLPVKGAAYNRAVDGAAAAFHVKKFAEELRGHVASSHGYLKAWLKKNGWATEVKDTVVVEQSYAIHVTGSISGASARGIAPPDEETHHYTGLKPGEIPGTVDLVLHRSDGDVLVLDHKTGFVDHGFAQPAELPQMRTLGLIAKPAAPRGRVHLAIFHADRLGLPNVLHDTIDRVALQAHRADLQRALFRIGDGSLRPGEHCKRCPAADTCPARTADVLSDASAALVAAGVEKLSTTNDNASKLSKEEQAGRLYALLQAFRRFDKMAAPEIRRMLAEGAAIELPTGEALTLQHQEYETLSKASVVEALGKLAGEKELARLRKLGAIKMSSRDMIHAAPAAGRR